MTTAKNSAPRRFSWRFSLLVLWHVLLVSGALYVLYFLIPATIEQVQGQFFSDFGGWDMTPMTFGFFLMIQAAVFLPLALSVLVNRPQQWSGRIIWSCCAASLLLTLVAYGLLWEYSPRLPRYDLPQFRRSAWKYMLEFDGLFFFAAAFFSFACAALFGRGPFSLFAALFRRLFRRTAIVADAPPPQS